MITMHARPRQTDGRMNIMAIAWRFDRFTKASRTKSVTVTTRECGVVMHSVAPVCVSVSVYVCLSV